MAKRTRPRAAQTLPTPFESSALEANQPMRVFRPWFVPAEGDTTTEGDESTVRQVPNPAVFDDTGPGPSPAEFAELCTDIANATGGFNFDGSLLIWEAEATAEDKKQRQVGWRSPVWPRALTPRGGVAFVKAALASGRAFQQDDNAQRAAAKSARRFLEDAYLLAGIVKGDYPNCQPAPIPPTKRKLGREQVIRELTCLERWFSALAQPHPAEPSTGPPTGFLGGADCAFTTKSARHTKWRGRGRTKADDETIKREAQVAADWRRARDSGTAKVDFANDNRMRMKELDRLLDRVAKRRNHSE